MLETIRKPTLILDEGRMIRNIERMAAKARRSGVLFKPHFKTHQSAAIGEVFRERGVRAITVSSLDMAAYFAARQWEDITVAFPVNLRQIEEINCLAERVTLQLLVESREAVEFLQKNLSRPVQVWIKIDTGSRRTGIPAAESGAVIDLAKTIRSCRHLSFRGLLSHAGHSYQARGGVQVEAVYRDTVSKLRALKGALEAEGIHPVLISHGDTPTCSVVEDLSEVDEIRPGNFVFYDLTQLAIGSCAEEDLAVAVACPVVALHGEREELVLYGGAVHLSKEFLTRPDGQKMYGGVARPAQGWGPLLESSYVSSLSQEHGIVRAGKDLLERVRVGDLLMVLPVHSCLTVDLLREFLSLEADSTPQGQGLPCPP